ncbi:hypothetical protein GCM10022221_06850 [Actinocorallia aurea]
MVDPLSAEERAADLAEQMLEESYYLPRTIVEYPAGAGTVERREALRPVYDAIVARIGEPTLLCATAGGPSVRWARRTDTLLLAGDRTAATLVCVDTGQFIEKEREELLNTYAAFPPHEPPYLWRLDRGGPGVTAYRRYHGRTETEVNWDEFGDALTRVLESFVEHMPVQAGDGYAAFKLRGGGRNILLNHDPRDKGEELCAIVEDRGPEGEDVMRARGWRTTDRWNRWRIDLPEADPGAPAEIARVVIAELRGRGVHGPASVRAHDATAGDIGDLWIPGLGVGI